MNLINEDFCKIMPNHFLTENVSLFLYSLIKCSRPKNIIEVGFGYSTLFILKSIRDIQKEVLPFPEKVFSEEKNTFSGKKYNPTFNVVENYSHQNHIKNYSCLEKFDTTKNINFINSSIDEYLKSSKEKYDFVWIDFGSASDYMHFFKIFLEKLNSGGFIIIHSTLDNLFGKLFVTELKLMNSYENSLEIMSIVEPHKSVQNSFTIIKKVLDYNIYSVDTNFSSSAL